MDKGEKKSELSAVAKREEELLAFWRAKGIFEKTLEKNAGNKHFVFYDGPPFATGLPHYGHLLAGMIKDAIPRYRTMKGDHVRRVWGWDCHGLPIETMIEKELGLEHKKDIEEFGIGKFNAAAKESVFRYDRAWKEVIPRMGRWIDMESSYSTMDPKYTESVWWAFSELYKKDLLYKGHKVMHICPRCETTLANSEATSEYKDVTDISLTAKFELVDEPRTFLLAWTTTPWTLPGNVALAVGEDIEYVKVKLIPPPEQDSKDYKKWDGKKESYILSKEILYSRKPISPKATDMYLLDGYLVKVVAEMKGSDLVGKEYKKLFAYERSGTDAEQEKNGWKVYAADFVTTESGTGIVHIAPAFGEDDNKLSKEYNLPVVHHIGMDGVMKDWVADFKGLAVKTKDDNQSTDIAIIKHLAHAGLLFSKLKIVHSYPHCWRCDTPLLNYATSSWFIKVTALKEKLLSANSDITWIPESIKDGRFGKWLEGARDWAVSRTRFWGAPLPIWECDSCEERIVLGSIAEVKEHTHKNNFFLMRHGEADNNTRGISSSLPDNPDHITEKGKKQTLASAEELKKEGIDIIVTSPFIRTVETAEIVADTLGISRDDIVTDVRLAEVNVGEFNGKPHDEYHTFFDSYEEYFAKTPPGGENLMDLKRRVLDLLQELQEKYEGKNILLVSHEYTSWMLASVSDGLSVADTIAIKEAAGDDFIKNAEVQILPYAPIPLNADLELDFHRPYIDEITFPCSCGGSMVRIPDVSDCWFESGSMPFAQFHYPFENKEAFANNFPADFIAEGVDQTRGWFYNMLVLAIALFDETAFKNVIVNGTILTEDGQKMSKRLKNYPDPTEVVNKYGADALRYYFLSSPAVHGEDLRFSERGVDEAQKKVIARLGNVVSFYELYKSDEKKIKESDNVLDLWIFARLHELTAEVESAMNRFELDRATRPIGLFVDDLSTWYVRRSRDRMKAGAGAEEARATLRTVLVELSKVLAPFLPFTAEDIYGRVGGEKESVHLEDWPEVVSPDETILSSMEKVRASVSLALEERASSGMKVRQPLASATFKDSTLAKSMELLDIIKDEINVKDILFDEGISNEVALDINLTPELKKEGELRELIRFVQSLRKKEKLSPSDTPILHITTDTVGEEFVKSVEVELKEVTLVRSVVFDDAGVTENVTVGEISFGLSVEL